MKCDPCSICYKLEINGLHFYNVLLQGNLMEGKEKCGCF
ncbi:hypothetical protein SC1083_1912 [Aggregatibacter actinomycetemcomitans serotype e str. SC1083]|uniref:Uncharacterized protein n=1 Tax=Aggregatibacter actinomycetemcomitans serotype e str. SC1083 TaxID=907488 RepID=G4AAN9_AGGAC|nr:hypothetical protein SC1083_1912 [Aggregatibacter actinomycetemcomitans serotype e str. SC1083]